MLSASVSVSSPSKSSSHHSERHARIHRQDSITFGLGGNGASDNRLFWKDLSRRNNGARGVFGGFRRSRTAVSGWSEILHYTGWGIICPPISRHQFRELTRIVSHCGQSPDDPPKKNPKRNRFHSLKPISCLNSVRAGKPVPSERRYEN